MQASIQTLTGRAVRAAAGAAAQGGASRKPSRKPRLAARRWTRLVAAVALVATACGERGAPAVAAANGDGFAGVVTDVLPSIVLIQAEAALPAALEQLLPGHPALDEPMPIGMGSGIILSEDGFILTNNHVIQDAERVLVMLHDRRHFEAVVIGRDPSTEVAVLRIEQTGLPAARLGDSDAVSLGDWVLAMGSPLGLQFSVTGGIVSGVGRAPGIVGMVPGSEVQGAAPLEHFIQTDAALGPGNSGGPLVNRNGEVIGINTAMAAPPGVPASYGFAIPSNLARAVADQLIRYGEVRRPYLGALLVDITPRLAREENLERVEGAGVAQLEEGGPAHRAGIQGRDIITAIAGEPVITVSDLQAVLAQQQPGATVPLRVLRQGQILDVNVELGVVRSGVGRRGAGPE